MLLEHRTESNQPKIRLKRRLMARNQQKLTAANPVKVNTTKILCEGFQACYTGASFRANL